jgi:hypothetical protein
MIWYAKALWGGLSRPMATAYEKTKESENLKRSISTINELHNKLLPRDLVNEEKSTDFIK